MIMPDFIYLFVYPKAERNIHASLGIVGYSVVSLELTLTTDSKESPFRLKYLKRNVIPFSGCYSFEFLFKEFPRQVQLSVKISTIIFARRSHLKPEYN